MKNTVIFRVWRNCPLKIGYLSLVVMVATICSVAVVSCSKCPKGRVEQKFEEYVKRNFANPSDFVEIASIELEDSLDMKELCETYINESCPDSIELKISQQMVLASSLIKNAPTWFKEMNKEHIMGLLKSDDYFLRLNPKWEYLKEEYCKVDSLNLIQKFYRIKARVKENGSVLIKDFYAVDYMIVDSLKISDKEILQKDSPREVLDLTDALESYMESVRIKMDYLKEFIELNNKLQQLSY